jgi:hypothetical protein
MFSLEADFDDQDIERWINEDVQDWINSLIEFYRIRGRELVDKARAKTAAEQGFNNITWNLRSSIGMCIVDAEGNILETYFPPIGKGAHGDKVGREMAENIALYGRKMQEVSMVFVAGEYYAGFVQAKGKDVIKHVIGDNLEEALKGIL